MFPQQWASPCGNQCTNKYAALMQIPWRVFCKKGCDSDGETWEDCLGECNEICYKDPVLKDHQWTAYIDRSPGADNYSMVARLALDMSPYGAALVILRFLLGGLNFACLIRPAERGINIECFHACVAGCAFKFSVPAETVDQVHPNRPPKPCLVDKPAPSLVERISVAEDMPCTSA